MTKKSEAESGARERSQAASLLGRRSAQVRSEKWGKREFVQRMREWGKLGGRPPLGKRPVRAKED